MSREIYYSEKYYDEENEYRNFITVREQPKDPIFKYHDGMHILTVSPIVHIIEHVVLPKELVQLVPKNHLMSEQEWRSIGVQQSQGWVHYMTHKPEPHILLFKRKKTSEPERK